VSWTRRPIVFVLLLAFGCSTTVSIQRPVSQISREGLERLLTQRDATVTYAPPERQPENDAASDVEIWDDKAQWTRWESEQARSRGEPPGQRVEAPLDAVKRISLCDSGCHGRGALEGAGFGAAAGLLVSAILAARCKPNSGLGNLCPLAWIPGPVLGILVGALIGSRGHPTVVEFQPPPK
jgi:hypothetical protein